MTNYVEEQQNELEALTSIFEEGSEFGRISDTEFVLKLKPFPTGEQENHVGVTLWVCYTAEYPDSPPNFELKDVVGLSEENQGLLKGKIEETIESSIGMAMVYSMAEACQDFLKENNKKALSMHEEMMMRMKQEGDEEGDENGEDDGDDDDDEEVEEPEWKGLAERTCLCKPEDRITTESFLEWKREFDAEMLASGVLKDVTQKAQTGKQFFLAARAAEDGTAVDSAADTGAGNGGDVLVYDAALFGEVDDGDLEDLSGGDD